MVVGACLAISISFTILSGEGAPLKFLGLRVRLSTIKRDSSAVFLFPEFILFELLKGVLDILKNKTGVGTTKPTAVGKDTIYLSSFGLLN